MATGTHPNLFRGTLLVLVLTTAFALWQSNRIKELERQLESASSSATAWAADLAAANEARDELAAQLENLGSRRVAISRDLSREGDENENQAPLLRRPLRSRGRAMSDPEDTKTMLTQMRGNLDGLYAGLFQRLNLPAPILDQLKDLLVERQASTRDALFVSRSGGVEPGSEAMRSLVQETQAEIDNNIRSLLGEERFQQYQEFNLNRAEYALAEQLQRRLSYTQSPLTIAQADELVRIFRDNRGGNSSVGSDAVFSTVTVSPNGPVPVAGVFIGDGGRAALTDQAVDQAGAVLTSEQLRALQEIQAEHQARQSTLEVLRVFRGEMGRDGPPSGDLTATPVD